MYTCTFPDMYVLSFQASDPWASNPQASGYHIRRSPHVYVITNNHTIQIRFLKVCSVSSSIVMEE